MREMEATTSSEADVNDDLKLNCMERLMKAVGVLRTRNIEVLHNLKQLKVQNKCLVKTIKRHEADQLELGKIRRAWKKTNHHVDQYRLKFWDKAISDNVKGKEKALQKLHNILRRKKETREKRKAAYDTRYLEETQLREAIHACADELQNKMMNYIKISIGGLMKANYQHISDNELEMYACQIYHYTGKSYRFIPASKEVSDTATIEPPKYSKGKSTKDIRKALKNIQ